MIKTKNSVIFCSLANWMMKPMNNIESIDIFYRLLCVSVCVDHYVRSFSTWSKIKIIFLLWESEFSILLIQWNFVWTFWFREWNNGISLTICMEYLISFHSLNYIYVTFHKQKPIWVFNLQNGLDQFAKKKMKGKYLENSAWSTWCENMVKSCY